MGRTEFDDSKDVPEAHSQSAENQLPRSGDSRKPSNKKTKNNQEWGGDIVASGYLMILYQ
jgi:hypothetical protein